MMLVFPYAYINPQTGSLIHQLIIAALLGGTVALKLGWTEVKAFFKKLFAKKG